MANLLDRFKKSSVGSRGRIADYTSRISSRGDFTRIQNFNVILNSWSNILLTPLRTYTHDPEYGSELYKMIFEPADGKTAERIKYEIQRRIQRYDDRANIQDISISFLNNLKGFNVVITANYQGEQSQLELSFDEQTYFNFLEETV